MTNHLTKRGNVYYFRRKIPADLVEHFGRSQFMYSLNVKDPAEARALAAEHTVSTNQQFEAARRKLGTAATPKPKREPVILREYILDPDTKDSLPSGQSILFDPANPGDHVEVTLAGEPVALLYEDSALHGTDVPLSKSYRRQVKDARQFRTGLLVARAAHGERTAPPASAPVTATPQTPTNDAGKPLTLRDVVPNWITRNGPGKDAEKRTNRALGKR